MLDGLLGRGFAFKCKALIKSVKKRIDVIRSKRNATQKFLKKDIADLLANGLDINAYGRAEGLLVELKVSSCYDFVEHCCDFVIKHVSILQKLSTCPENCREAVSSLVFAATRFSDLPELRDLREMLQEKYGNSLEHFVNEEFVENLASKPAALERKVQLLSNIALEFSIVWDSEAFEKRMSRPPVNTVDEPKTYRSLNISNDRSRTESRGAKHDLFRNSTNELGSSGHRLQCVNNDDVSRRIKLTYPSRQESINNGNDIFNGKVESILTVDSLGGREVTALGGHEIDCRKGESAMETLTCGDISLGTKQEQRIGRSLLCSGSEIGVKYGGDIKISQHVRLDVASGHVGETIKDGDKKPLNNNHQRGNEDAMNFSGKPQEIENLKLKPTCKYSRRPPYINSSSRMKDYDPTASCKSPRLGNDNECVSTAFSEQIRSIGGSEQIISGHHNHGREGHKYAKDYRQGEKDQLYDPGTKDYNHAANCKSPRTGNDNSCSTSSYSKQIRGAKGSEKSHFKQDFRHDEKDQLHDAKISGTSLPKPRSIRRKHSKTLANYDIGGNFENTFVKRKKHRSRRRDENKGPQLLMDEEEKMIDELLIHYSKKPSKLDHAKTRKKTRSHQMNVLPRVTESLESAGDYSDTIHSPDPVSLAIRSFSLPCEQIGQSEGTKVFARAASFQPNRSNEAKHVHPNLPEYEDLAARFATLRGR